MLVSRQSRADNSRRPLRLPQRTEAIKALSLWEAPARTAFQAASLLERVNPRAEQHRVSSVTARLIWVAPSTFIRSRRPKRWLTVLIKTNGQLAAIRISKIWCMTPASLWVVCSVKSPKALNASMLLHKRTTKLREPRVLTITKATTVRQARIIIKYLAHWEPLRLLVEAVSLIIIIVKEIADFKYRI